MYVRMLTKHINLLSIYISILILQKISFHHTYCCDSCSVYSYYSSYHIYLCMKRKFKKAFKSQSTREQTSYETVGHSSGTITKGELELPYTQTQPTVQAVK